MTTIKLNFRDRELKDFTVGELDFILDDVLDRAWLKLKADQKVDPDRELYVKHFEVVIDALRRSFNPQNKGLK